MRADLVVGRLGPIAANLFRFVAAVYEARSLILTSTWALEKRTNLLPDAAAAILDRLLHHSQAVVLSGESYRVCEAKEVRLAIL